MLYARSCLLGRGPVGSWQGRRRAVRISAPGNRARVWSPPGSACFAPIRAARALLWAPSRPWLVADLAASAKASSISSATFCKTLLEWEWSTRGKRALWSRSLVPCCRPGARTTADRGASGSTHTSISMAATSTSGPVPRSTRYRAAHAPSTRSHPRRSGSRLSVAATLSRSTPTRLAQDTCERRAGEAPAEHTTLVLECIDRMYLNVYVPVLQEGRARPGSSARLRARYRLSMVRSSMGDPVTSQLTGSSVTALSQWFSRGEQLWHRTR